VHVLHHLQLNQQRKHHRSKKQRSLLKNQWKRLKNLLLNLPSK
jgi:hypothetical protein